jgi:hypothetical protein
MMNMPMPDRRYGEELTVSRHFEFDLRERSVAREKREPGGYAPFRTELVPKKYVEPPPPWALSPTEHETAIEWLLDRLDQ